MGRIQVGLHILEVVEAEPADTGVVLPLLEDKLHSPHNLNQWEQVAAHTIKTLAIRVEMHNQLHQVAVHMDLLQVAVVRAVQELVPK
jgi:hypothetical protein